MPETMPATAGIEHLVFDFRTSFEHYEECVEMIGTEVLPRLRRA